VLYFYNNDNINYNNAHLAAYFPGHPG